MNAGLRDFVKQISPPWLSGGTAEKYMYVVGLGADACLEKLNQGMRLHMPTYGDASALPYVGADRLIPQGFNEPSAGYASRLKLWLDDWQVAGNLRSVLQQTLGELAPALPMVRTVTDSSCWDTYIAGPYLTATNPSTTYPSHYRAVPNWNWDNEADPHPGPLGTSTAAWWRWWLLLFADIFPVGGGIATASNATPIVVTTNSAHGLVTGAVVWLTGVNGNQPANSPNGVAPWTITKTSNTTFTLNGSVGAGAGTGGTVYCITDPVLKPVSQNWILPAPAVGAPGVVIGDTHYAIGFSLPNGQNNAAGLIAGIKSIVALWKCANSWCRWQIVSFDTARFDPAQPADGTHNPDGTWGPWLKIATVNNISQYVPTRSGDARYMDPVL